MPVQVHTSFGQFLRRYRLAAGHTQEALAALSGLGVRTIADLERDISLFPHAHTVEALADTLHLSGSTRASFIAAARRRNVTFTQDQEETPVADGGAPSFVGRASELAAGARFFAGGCAPVLFFSGEPGIGKSRLLREVMIQARSGGWRVVAGGCDQRSGREPYAPFVQMLDETLLATSLSRRKGDLNGCGWLARLGPELAEKTRTPVPEWSLTPVQERRMIFAAARRYLTNIAGPAGTLLVLDDLQWAGSDALDLLACLVHERASERQGDAPSPAPLRVLGAYRASEVQSGHPFEGLLVDLAHDEHLSLYELDRLSEGEARLLAASLVGATPDAEQRIADVMARAEGVPFYLVNFAQAFRPGVEAFPPVSGDDFHSLAREQKTPWLVTATIRRRLSALPPEAQETLALAAIIGRVASLDLLRLAVRDSGDDLTVTLETACRAQLLEESSLGSTAYRFTHDLIRETLLDSLSSARQALLHRSVAEALEHLPMADRIRQAAALADHFARAGDVGRAFPYALQAGDQAEAASAHAEASAHFRAAARYADAAGARSRKAEALEKLGVSLLRYGHTDPALAALDEAAQLYAEFHDQESRYRTLAALIETHWQRGTAEEGLAMVRPLLAAQEEQGETPASPALAALYKSVCAAHRLDGQHEERARAAQRLERLARELHDDALLFAALQYQIYTARLRGVADTTLTALRDLLPLAERIGDPSVLLETYNHIAAEYLFRGEFSRSLADNQRALEHAQRSGSPPHITRMLLNRAELQYFRGAWADARADVTHADAIAEESNQFGITYSLIYRLYERGRLELAEGHEELARWQLYDVLQAATTSHDLQALALSRQLLSELDLLGGRATEVYASLPPLLDQLQVVPHWADATRIYLAWALLAMGREEEAAHEIETCIASMRVRTMRLWLVDGLRVRAMLAIQRRQWEAAQADVDEAIALAGAMPYPYAELKALWVYGDLEVARGDPTAARQRFEQALAICARLGEGLYRRRVAQALSALSSV